MWKNTSDQIYVCTSTTSRGYCGKYDLNEGIIYSININTIKPALKGSLFFSH